MASLAKVSENCIELTLVAVLQVVANSMNLELDFSEIAVDAIRSNSA
jgi:hypothetical protein